MASAAAKHLICAKDVCIIIADAKRTEGSVRDIANVNLCAVTKLKLDNEKLILILLLLIDIMNGFNMNIYQSFDRCMSLNIALCLMLGNNFRWKKSCSVMNCNTAIRHISKHLSLILSMLGDI